MVVELPERAAVADADEGNPELAQVRSSAGLFSFAGYRAQARTAQVWMEGF